MTQASKQHDYTIDFLKAIAAILITNSHMSAMYGDYSYLATGGAIGDTLFFFCSGYTLLWSKKNYGFFNWYKRRISRIFPTIFTIGLFLTSSFSIDYHHYDHYVELGSGWFIVCIMLYYILFYPIKKYLVDRLNLILFIISIICIAVYFFTPLGTECSLIYGATYYKWFHYFLSMLLGSIIGKKALETPSHNFKTLPTVFILAVSIIVYYTILTISSRTGVHYIQLFAIPVLLLSNYLFWCTCNTDGAHLLLNNKYTKSIILFIGSLCLEIYLIQGYVFTIALNGLFPLNIPIIIIGVIIAAYLTRCCSRFVVQTINDAEYDWNAIIAFN